MIPNPLLCLKEKFVNCNKNQNRGPTARSSFKCMEYIPFPALHTHIAAGTLRRICLYNFCHVNLPFGNSEQSVLSRPLDIPSFTPKIYKLLMNKQLSDKIKQGYLSVQDRKYRKLPYATLRKMGQYPNWNVAKTLDLTTLFPQALRHLFLNPPNLL